MGPLTEQRAKPVLPFAGHYRLIDFVLSNCTNSEIVDVWVLQQFQPHKLEHHLSNGRPWDLDRTRGGLLILHPFSGGKEGGFHEGNADALWRHRRLIAQMDPDVVLVLSADAVYSLDYRKVVDRHAAVGADVTMVTTRVDEDAGRFGVVGVDEEGRVVDFAYKPDSPESDLVTIEVFAYRPQALLSTLDELAGDDGGLKDFGDELLPRLVDGGGAWEYRHEAYWRDVGTPQAYWQAHMDLLAGPERTPGFSLDDPEWPVRTRSAHRPPAWVEGSASIDGSLISPACRVAGRVVGSVLSPGVVVEEGAVVERSVLLHGAVVRAGARVEQAIVDTDMEVAAGALVRSDDPDEPVAVVSEGARE